MKRHSSSAKWIRALRRIQASFDRPTSSHTSRLSRAARIPCVHRIQPHTRTSILPKQRAGSHLGRAAPIKHGNAPAQEHVPEDPRIRWLPRQREHARGAGGCLQEGAVHDVRNAVCEVKGDAGNAGFAGNRVETCCRVGTGRHGDVCGAVEDWKELGCEKGAFDLEKGCARVKDGRGSGRNSKQGVTGRIYTERSEGYCPVIRVDNIVSEDGALDTRRIDGAKDNFATIQGCSSVCWSCITVKINTEAGSNSLRNETVHECWKVACLVEHTTLPRETQDSIKGLLPYRERTHDQRVGRRLARHLTYHIVHLACGPVTCVLEC